MQISWYLPFCKLYSWNSICFKCQICLQYSLNLDTIFLENLPKIDYAWNVKILCIQNSVNLSNPATDLSKSEQRDLHHFHHRMVDIHRAGCKRWPRYSTRLRLFRKVSGRGPREPRILKSELITGFFKVLLNGKVGHKHSVYQVSITSKATLKWVVGYCLP